MIVVYGKGVLRASHKGNDASIAGVPFRYTQATGPKACRSQKFIGSFPVA
jgi:hypothetical protein